MASGRVWSACVSCRLCGFPFGDTCMGVLCGCLRVGRLPPLSAVEPGAAVRSTFMHRHLPVGGCVKGVFVCDWSICTGWPPGMGGVYVWSHGAARTHAAFSPPGRRVCASLCARSYVAVVRSALHIHRLAASALCVLRVACLCCMLGCVSACWDRPTQDLAVRPPRVLPETGRRSETPLREERRRRIAARRGGQLRPADCCELF